MPLGISAMQYKDEDYVTLWGYSSGYDRQPAIGVRDIHMNDTMESVLTQLGVSNASEAMAYIEEIAVGSYEEYSDIDAKIRKVFERGSFSLNGTGATILNDGSHRLSEMRVSLCVHYADSQDNKWYVMRLEFERESEDRFVGRLKRYDMDVYT